MARAPLLRLMGVVCLCFFDSAAFAAETITYTYDSLGRLVSVSHSGTVNNGVSVNYTYDPADNRSNVTVTGATGTPPRRRVVVVPLNGYTIIPLPGA